MILAAVLATTTTQAAQLQIVSEPLASQLQTPSETLFTRIDSQASGLVVQNLYDDPSMWGERYREFMGGGMGSGVAAGDFDGDGKVDLYVSLKTKPGRLFRNLGNWRFEDVTDRAGLSEEASLLGWFKSAISSSENAVWRQGSVFADVNNDGHLDLYVCRNAAPNLLYINQGNGTFKEEAETRGLATIDGSVVGAFADYDRDGWLDVLVLTNLLDGTEPAGRPDRLFRNLGGGRFAEVTEKAGIAGATFGHSATWIDFDGDLWPDLFIANDFSGPDHFYRNNRDGTFSDVSNAIVPHTPYSSMGSDLGDVNNDGHFDLLLTDMATTTRERDRRGLAASRNDVLTTGTTAGVAPQYMRNALLLNSGLGSFAEAACWAGLDATDWTWSVRFEDFDNDGWEDLHVTNGMVREANNSDLLARMMRAMSDLQRIAVIKRAPPLEESNLAYRNLRGEGFEPVTASWGLQDVGVTFGAATADFDNDGDLDLVHLNYEGGLHAFRNDASGQHRLQVRLRGSQSNRFGVGAVVRVESETVGPQSRSLTVARGYASGSELVAHFGLGPDRAASRLVIQWPSGIVQEFSNLPADHAYLITESATSTASPSPTKPALFLPASTVRNLSLPDKSALDIPDREQAFLPFRTDRAGPGIAVADIDRDGQDDLFLAATTGSPARILIHRGDSYQELAASGIPTSNVEDGPPLLFDADGDGHPDLLLTKASANALAWPDAFQPLLYRNDGSGNFSPTSALPKLALNAAAAIAADIDRDGDLDLFLGARSIPGHYPDPPRSALLRNDGGRFVDVTASSPALANVGLVKSALFRDLDRDGHVDLVLALEWDFVRYFRNQGDNTFADETAAIGFDSGGRGWWNGLAAADCNGDGRLDFAVGNAGLNTTYTATPQHPATLFYGDFAQNGTQLLAEAEYDGDTLFPLRSRGDIGARLPSVLRAFPQNDAFAKATMAQVYGEKPLASARKLEADNLSSGIFLSQPDGRYRFVPLPRAAQIGSIIGLAAGDFDGDGLADLVATQNTDTAIPRFHGGLGLFLKGLGSSEFQTLSPTQSGFALHGNGRAIVALDPDRDSRPDLFLTRHGASSEFLANNAPKTRWITLRLAGPKSNPHAIGAQVELRYANGQASYHEIALGGGWFSQSAPTLHLSNPPDNPLSAATITWPSGSTTTHPDVPSQGPWLLAPQ